MKQLKNITIGFLVSFIGSIPLGYLNVIGYEIYRKSEINNLIFYLLGVVIIEALIIYGTLYFAHKLILKTKLNKLISLFSILFLAILTIYFYFSTSNNVNDSSFDQFLHYPTLIIGIILSSLNFAQVPFWLSWNLYLVNEKYISDEKKMKLFYLIGTVLSTFFGMLTLILSLNTISKIGMINPNFLSNNIWVLFLALTIFQIIQFMRKR